jgi:acyl carrier protein
MALHRLNSGECKFRKKFTVLDRLTPQPTERIVALVAKLLAKRGINRPVGHDDDLTESGLSSLDIVNLMLSVETEFGITVPEWEMTPANFRSIAQIGALVRILLGGD